MKPKYQQIIQFLLHQLKSGKFKEGDKFYSEAELKAKFSVSSATVIKAIGELVNEGMLVRQQGKGTFVSKARQGKLVKFFDHEKYNDVDEHVRVHSIKKENDPRILKELKLQHEDEYYHIIRVRLIDKLPIYVQHTYLLPEYFNEKALEEKEYYASIYERIREDSGIDLFNIGMGEVTRVQSPLPEFESGLLEIKEPNQPVIFIKRHSYLYENQPIEYVESYKKWNYFEIEIKTV